MDARRRNKTQLPHWDLTDLYPGRNSAALKNDLARVKSHSVAFHKKYFGKLGNLSGVALGGAVRSYERIDETLSRIMSYAQLVHAADVADPEVAKPGDDASDLIFAEKADFEHLKITSGLRGFLRHYELMDL